MATSFIIPQFTPTTLFRLSLQHWDSPCYRYLHVCKFSKRNQEHSNSPWSIPFFMIWKVWQPRNPPKMLNSIVSMKTDVTWNQSPWNYMNARSKPSDNYITLPYTNIQTNHVFNLQYRHVRCGRWNTVNNLTYKLKGPDLCITQTSYDLRPHITKSLPKIN